MKHYLIAIFCFLSLNLFAQTNPLDYSLDRLNAFSTLSITDTSELNKYREEYRNPNKQIDSLKGIILESYLTKLFRQIDDSLLCSINYDLDDLSVVSHYGKDRFGLSHYLSQSKNITQFKNRIRQENLGYYYGEIEQDSLGYYFNYWTRFDTMFYDQLPHKYHRKYDETKGISSISPIDKERFFDFNFYETWSIDSGRFVKDVEFSGISLKSIYTDIYPNLDQMPLRFPLLRNESNTPQENIEFDVVYDVWFNQNGLGIVKRELVEELYFKLIKGISENKFRIELSKKAKLAVKNNLLAEDRTDRLFYNSIEVSIDESLFNSMSTIPVELSSISGFRFYETWRFNSSNFSFYKQVNKLKILIGKDEELEFTVIFNND